MHTIEHIGLGRYGDEINPVADLIAISELKRVTIKNGTLLLVVPVGKPKIVYNAHRIYSYDMVMNMMEGFYLKEFSMVYDNCDFINKTYGCGCFWFIKK